MHKDSFISLQYLKKKTANYGHHEYFEEQSIYRSKPEQRGQLANLAPL